ncbi:MAG: nicotinamide mononucleotide transporter [Clostridiales bacterium]|nr:nicotinamide mononucleotide transporter [Clostridiales bacterium]
MKKVFKIFNTFDICLWVVSVVSIILAFSLSSRRDYFTLASSITGVSALMFIVKGNVIGQFLVVIFAVFYGIVSYFFKYYGEMITYLGMSAPAAICAIVSWMRHPYKDRSQVAVGTLNAKKIAIVCILSAAITVAFYFILRALGTANLVISTASVTTSMLAACLTFLRSPLYGVAYACNDIVLIVMWILATVKDISYLPMVICFVLFLIYDVYGFFSWSLMRKRQNTPAEQTDEKAE